MGKHSAADRLEETWQKSHNPSPSQPGPSGNPTATGTIKPLERDIVRRIKYVAERILDVVPEGMRNDWRYTAMKTMIMESLKDIAMVPDEVIVPMVKEFAEAMAFIAEGSMEELEEALKAQEEGNAESE